MARRHLDISIRGSVLCDILWHLPFIVWQGFKILMVTNSCKKILKWVWPWTHARRELPKEKVGIALHGVNNCLLNLHLDQKKDKRGPWNIYELWRSWHPRSGAFSQRGPVGSWEGHRQGQDQDRPGASVVSFNLCLLSLTRACVHWKTLLSPRWIAGGW